MYGHLLGENCCWSLLGLKGLKVDGPAGGLNPRFGRPVVFQLSNRALSPCNVVKSNLDIERKPPQNSPCW